MLKYAIPMMFLAGAAVAQVAQPSPQPVQSQSSQGQSQPGIAPQVPQPATGAGQPGAASSVAGGTGTAGQPSVAHVNARNAAIQQIEQALQILRQNNQ